MYLLPRPNRLIFGEEEEGGRWGGGDDDIGDQRGCRHCHISIRKRRSVDKRRENGRLFIIGNRAFFLSWSTDCHQSIIHGTVKWVNVTFILGHLSYYLRLSFPSQLWICEVFSPKLLMSFEVSFDPTLVRICNLKEKVVRSVCHCWW